MAANVSLRVWVLRWLLGAFAHSIWRQRQQRRRRRRWIRNLYMTIYVDVGIFSVSLCDTHTSSLLQLFHWVNTSKCNRCSKSYTLWETNFTLGISNIEHRALNNKSLVCSWCSSVLHFFCTQMRYFKKKKTDWPNKYNGTRQHICMIFALFIVKPSLKDVTTRLHKHVTQKEQAYKL